MSLNAQASRKLRAENRAVSISPTAKAPFSLGMGLWRVCTGTPKCQTCTAAVGALRIQPGTLAQLGGGTQGTNRQSQEILKSGLSGWRRRTQPASIPQSGDRKDQCPGNSIQGLP